MDKDTLSKAEILLGATKGVESNPVDVDRRRTVNVKPKVWSFFIIKVVY